MIYEEKNFVPLDTLAALNKKMLEVYYNCDSQYTGDLLPRPIVRKMVTLPFPHFKYAVTKLGKEMLEPCEAIQKYVRNIYPTAEAQAVGYQYFTGDQWTHSVHRDKVSWGDSLDNTMTSMLYSHTVWKPEWEMNLNFCDHEHVTIPEPNTFVAFTRDERPWVSEPKFMEEGYIRIFLGVSWILDPSKA